MVQRVLTPHTLFCGNNDIIVNIITTHLLISEAIAKNAHNEEMHTHRYVIGSRLVIKTH